MAGQYAWLGPGIRMLTVSELMQWMTIRIAVTSDERLREVAADLGLVQATTERRGRVWWRQVMSRGDGVVMIAAGPSKSGAEEP
jgi:hypothetical protein